MYPQLIKDLKFIYDIIVSVTDSSSLRERLLLDFVFRLRCLCLNGNKVVLPVVDLGTKTSEDLTCRILEAVFPVQSYLVNVPEATSKCRNLFPRDDMKKVSFRLIITFFAQYHQTDRHFQSKLHYLFSFEPEPSRTR